VNLLYTYTSSVQEVQKYPFVSVGYQRSCEHTIQIVWRDILFC